MKTFNGENITASSSSMLLPDGEHANPQPAGDKRPLVSVILPAYNEAAILKNNLAAVLTYLKSRSSFYEWEIIIVDDGSRDGTGEIAEAFAGKEERPVIVIHHLKNRGLGMALRSGFRRSRGRYVVTLDIDLSYGSEHIGLLLDRIISSRAQVVLAAPYVTGGKLSAVPTDRRILSVAANKLLSALTNIGLSTFTSMVRAYDGPFLRALSLRGTGMEIMPEIIYKTIALQGAIEEIPAHLDWSQQRQSKGARRSSMLILKQVSGTLLSGFILRPAFFFIFPGLALLLFAIYVNFWMFSHFLGELDKLPSAAAGLSEAFANAFAAHPHTFITGFLSLMLAVQVLSLGLISLQNKKYFEELFIMATDVLRRSRVVDGNEYREEDDPVDEYVVHQKMKKETGPNVL